jgi:hypothetical protein
VLHRAVSTWPCHATVLDNILASGSFLELGLAGPMMCATDNVLEVRISSVPSVPIAVLHCIYGSLVSEQARAIGLQAAHTLMNQLHQIGLQLRIGEFANQHDDSCILQNQIVENRHVELM